MDEFNDRHYRTPLVQDYDPEEVAASGSASKKNRVPMETRPEFGVTVVEESSAGITKDITVIHSDWKTGKKGPGVELYVPGPKRNAVAWQVAHTYFSYDGEEMFVCNICGKDLKLSGTAGAISSHLKRKHVGIKEKMEAMEQRNQKKKRKRELPMSTNGGSSNPSGGSSKKSLSGSDSKVKMIPFPRDIPLGPGSGSGVLPPGERASNVGKAQSSKFAERRATAVQAQKEAQIMYLIGQGLDFSHVESMWHKQLLESTVMAARAGAAPMHLELSTKDVRNRVFTASRNLRRHLRERIARAARQDAPLCGSANHWTSREQNVTYVSFSVQWIEDFELQSAVLAVYVMDEAPGKQQQQQISAATRDFSTQLVHWKLGVSLKFVVTDRKGESNAFGSAIEKLSAGSTDDIVHIGCLDDMLNQVATKAFEGALGVGAGGDYGEFDRHLQPSYGSGDAGDDTETDYDDDEMDVVDDMNNASTKPRAHTSKKNLLPKVRKLVRHFESSIQASDELRVIAKQLCASHEEREALKALVQDVNTKWWSTQNMLERLFGLREAIATYVGRKWMPGATSKEKRPPRLAEPEWEALEELFFMLRPLRFAQQMLHGQKSITSSFVPLVIHLIYKELESIHLEQTNSANVKTIAKEMLNTMDELFGNFASREHSSSSAPLGVAKIDSTGVGPCEVRIHKAILMAHALDPRFKPLSVFPAHVQDQIWTNLMEEMIELGPAMTAAENELLAKQEEEDESPRISEHERRQRSGGISELDSLFQLYAAKQTDSAMRVKQSPVSGSGDFDADAWKRKCELELKQYRETGGMEPKMDSNALKQWWGEESRSTQYPILWRLAQRVLSINATSAPAHRAFSTVSSLSIHNRCCTCSAGGGTRGDELLHFLHENVKLLDEEHLWDDKD